MALADKITEDLNKEMLNDIYLLKKRLMWVTKCISQLNYVSILNYAWISKNNNTTEKWKQQLFQPYVVRVVMTDQ